MDSSKVVKRTRCKKGTHYDKKTGECVPNTKKLTRKNQDRPKKVVEESISSALAVLDQSSVSYMKKAVEETLSSVYSAVPSVVPVPDRPKKAVEESLSSASPIVPSVETVPDRPKKVVEESLSSASPIVSSPTPKKEKSPEKPVPKRPRCKKGTHYDKKKGECVPNVKPLSPPNNEDTLSDIPSESRVEQDRQVVLSDNPKESTPESSKESTPESSKESTPESSKESTPESSKESTPESSKESTPESSKESNSNVVLDPIQREAEEKEAAAAAATVLEIPAEIPAAAIPLNKNAFLLQKELAEHEDAAIDPDDQLYPTLNDPNFSYKIAKRQEFADTKYEGEITDIKKQANILCKSKFELMPHQLFVRNFLSFQTPYNSLLLYHGLGSGKTCSAIGIAEEMRAYMKQMGITKRIIIVASPNVQDNFRLQLFDDRKLQLLPDGNWNLNTCIGSSLLQEINPTNLRGLTRERIVSQIKSIIQNYYVFMGNKGEFANYIKKISAIPEDAGYSQQEMADLREKKIKAHFNNRLVVIDEVHNIRISDANKTKLTAVLLNEVAKKSENMRLLLLSATPMYNSYSEIIWLVNLLNSNDKRGLIKSEDVFKPDGSFIEERRDAAGKLIKEGGRELLSRKLTGYISYVRGENPYIFPYRIYPETFAPQRKLIPSQYPSLQMNQQPISEPLQFIPVYTNRIGEYQSIGYQLIMSYLGLKSQVITDKMGKERLMPSFENMESFGYTLLLPPLEALIMVYPSPSLDPKTVFDEEESKEVIRSIIGKQGLSNIMSFSRVEKPVPRRFDYIYKPKAKKDYGEIFHQSEIGKYSAKIANICEIIRKPSAGIILIYSQYIDGGIVPMALALESMGFSRYASTQDHNRNLFKRPYEQVDAITMQKRSDMPRDADFKPAKYVMITGEKDFSQRNDEDIKYITNKANSDGSLVKVVLISMAASEGLDFKNIRQVHILEPWYNMNRVEQIIGRGVRNSSHCDLDFEDRNVEIYLHAMVLDADEESADLYVYRSAEKKAIQIGKVTRLLKETAVDCQLNIAQTNFTEAKLLENVANQSIEINLSSGATVPFKIGDKPRTDVCDYMADCDFKCAVKTDLPAIETTIKTTYDENYVKTNSAMIMKKIRDLFLERTTWKRENLLAAINIIKPYPIVQIYYALTRFINNKTETLTDKYGRMGYLVSRGNYYAFQPNEIMDESASTFERSFPVDYKQVSLRMELPKEIKPFEEEPKIPGAAATALQETYIERPLERLVSIGRPYDTIFNNLRESVQMLSKKDITIKASEGDWYKHANKVVDELLTVHEIPSELINKYVIYHFLDKLSVREKLTVVSHIYDNPPTSAYETVIKMYFDELLLETSDESGLQYAIVLANGESNEMYIKSGDSWVPSQYTDEKLFANVRRDKLQIPISKIHPTDIGFMHPFKEKEIVFKTKDMTQKRNNKGAKCVDSSKPVVAGKIGAILDNKDIYTNTVIERPELCIILEILMRYLTEKNEKERNGKVLFFGPERTNEMKISNIRT